MYDKLTKVTILKAAIAISIALMLSYFFPFTAYCQSIKQENKNVIAICPLALLPGIPNAGFFSKVKLKYEHAINEKKSVGVFLSYNFYPHKDINENKFNTGVECALFGRHYFKQSLNGFYGQVKVQGYKHINSYNFVRNYYAAGIGAGYQLIKGRFSTDFGVGIKLTSYPYGDAGNFAYWAMPLWWYTVGSGSLFDGQLSLGFTF